MGRSVIQHRRRGGVRQAQLDWDRVALVGTDPEWLPAGLPSRGRARAWPSGNITRFLLREWFAVKSGESVEVSAIFRGVCGALAGERLAGLQ